MYREEETGEVEVLKTVATPEGGLVYTYGDYVAHGGRIDEDNYTRVMQRAQNESSVGAVGAEENYAQLQTATIANASGVSLEKIRDEVGLDPVCIYGILRSDKFPTKTTNHHGQMTDEQLLVEALRMLGEQSAVDSIIAKYPHISFN